MCRPRDPYSVGHWLLRSPRFCSIRHETITWAVRVFTLAALDQGLVGYTPGRPTSVRKIATVNPRGHASTRFDDVTAAGMTCRTRCGCSARGRCSKTTGTRGWRVAGATPPPTLPLGSLSGHRGSAHHRKTRLERTGFHSAALIKLLDPRRFGTRSPPCVPSMTRPKARASRMALPELMRYLDGACRLKRAARKRPFIANPSYAKRQRTWVAQKTRLTGLALFTRLSHSPRFRPLSYSNLLPFAECV